MNEESITMREALMLDIKDLKRQRDEAREAFAIATDQLVQAQATLREAREALREIAAADWRTSGELRGMARRALEATK